MLKKNIILLASYKDPSNHLLARRVPYVCNAKYMNYEDAFLNPLSRIFSKVLLYDYLSLLLERGFKKLNEELIELVKKEKVDYLLWIANFDTYEIREETFEIIRQMGTRIIGWFSDDEVRFEYHSKWSASYLDFVLTNDPEAVPKYEEMGIPAKFLLPDIWNVIPRDWSKKEEKYDVSFVGAIRANRENYISFAKKEKINVDLFGIATRKNLSFLEIKNIFWQSKINLSFSKTYDNKRYGIKGRIFNVPLCGGFLLTEYFPSVEKFFKLDKEIVCFRSPSEMVEKIKYYLAHDKERIAIAKAGWERAGREYDSFILLSKIFEEIEKYFQKSNIRRNYNKVEYPKETKKRISYFYFHWGQAFLIENYKNFWHDAFLLSLSYHPHNLYARLYLMLGKMPSFFRFIFFLPNRVFLNLWYKIKPLLLILPFPRKLLKVYYQVKRTIKRRLFKDYFS